MTIKPKETSEDPVDRELRAQLEAIEAEEVPERLLELAKRLQSLLRDSGKR